MTIKDIIKMFKEESQSKVSDTHIIQWFNECEDEVQEYLGLPLDERINYTEADIADGATTKPIARTPYDKMYFFYLMARRDYANQEFENYANHQTQYSALFESYKLAAIREKARENISNAKHRNPSEPCRPKRFLWRTIQDSHL